MIDRAIALDFVRSHRRSVLTTIRPDGRPHLSNVLHVVGTDDVVRVSVTDSRTKVRNLRHRPWAALHVASDDFWSWVVVEGDVALSAVAEAPDDPTVDELVEVYRSAAGEHDDWDAFRRAMVAERRLVLRLVPTHAYGQLGRGG